MYHGELAQLGERLPCTQEVSGSTPLFSTTPDVLREAQSSRTHRRIVILVLLQRRQNPQTSCLLLHWNQTICLTVSSDSRCRGSVSTLTNQEVI